MQGCTGLLVYGHRGQGDHGKGGFMGGGVMGGGPRFPGIGEGGNIGVGRLWEGGPSKFIPTPKQNSG